MIRNYFDKPKYLRVPGKLFPVKEFYLEDMYLDSVRKS